MKVYLDQILPRIPQIISQIDREPFSLTYGCGDRVYWCWKFTDFPGARFQEYIYTLSWLYSSEGFENPWKGNQNILRMISSGFIYWSEIQYKNGSFDEAYPFEYSLAATAFTMFYLTEGFDLVKDDMDENTRLQFITALDKAATWLCLNDEKHGILSNHLAAAAAGIYNAGLILCNKKYLDRSGYFLKRIYDHQSVEGWYEEYGGADIGYQTHGSFYLARLWQRSGDKKLLESLKSATHFLKHFIHPDGSLGGEYASRNTMFYYPAVFEMIGKVCQDAVSVTKLMRSKIESHNTVGVEQMDAYNLFPVLNNYIFAFENSRIEHEAFHYTGLPFQETGMWNFENSGLIVKSTEKYYAVIGGKKGGVTRVWDKRTGQLAFQSSGYTLRKGNRWLSNQTQGMASCSLKDNTLQIEAPFASINRKVFSPWLFIAFRLFSLTFGRIPVVGYTIKGLLVKVLVRQKEFYPEKLFRRIEFIDDKIIIEDRLSDENVIVQHFDKFSTIHMGSSRYAHMQEELQRGTGYPQAVSEFDQHGLMKKTVIRFL